MHKSTLLANRKFERRGFEKEISQVVVSHRTNGFESTRMCFVNY